jgi:hypothetical protein
MIQSVDSMCSKDLLGTICRIAELVNFLVRAEYYVKSGLSSLLKLDPHRIVFLKQRNNNSHR